MQPWPMADLQPPAPLPPRPRRPARVAVAALLTGLSAAGMGVLLLTLIWTAAIISSYKHTNARSWILILGPMFLLVVGGAWLGFLAVAVWLGRRRARFGVSVTLSLMIPIYAFFAWFLGTDFLASGEGLDNTFAVNLMVLLILCVVQIPPAIVTPLLLIGEDVTAYLNSAQPG